MHHKSYSSVIYYRNKELYRKILIENIVRARLVDYLFPMSKVLKIRVGRSGKKKKGKKIKRQKYL